MYIYTYIYIYIHIHTSTNHVCITSPSAAASAMFIQDTTVELIISSEEIGGAEGTVMAKRPPWKKTSGLRDITWRSAKSFTW